MASGHPAEFVIQAFFPEHRANQENGLRQRAGSAGVGV